MTLSMGVPIPIFSRRILTKVARLLQWQVFFFFCHITECIRSLTLFTELLNYWTGKRKRIKVSAKGTLFMHSLFNVICKTRQVWVFSALCDFIFGIFFVAEKTILQFFFDILQQTEVSKSPMGPPFQVSRNYETVSKFSVFNFQNCFQNFFLFS